MAAIVYNQIPIFFSRLHGLVSISSSDFDNMDFFNKLVIVKNVVDFSIWINQFVLFLFLQLLVLWPQKQEI